MAAAEPGTGAVVKDCGLAVVVGSVVVGSVVVVGAVVVGALVVRVAVGTLLASPAEAVDDTGAVVVDGSGVETDAVVDVSRSTFGDRVASAVPTTAAPLIAAEHPVSTARITSATAGAAGPRFRIMFVRYFDGRDARWAVASSRRKSGRYAVDARPEGLWSSSCRCGFVRGASPRRRTRIRPVSGVAEGADPAPWGSAHVNNRCSAESPGMVPSSVGFW